MPQERTDPVAGPDGAERHPAFGVIILNRVHASPGEVLFQSDVRHGEYMRVEVCEAERMRDLNHDWVHPRRRVCQVSMSMAQFASFVASTGQGGGVPCTIEFTGIGDSSAGQRPGINPVSRLALTTDEVRKAADEAYAGIQRAHEAYEQALDAKAPAAVRKAALRDLRAAIVNASANVAYAAVQLDAHAEAVVERSRADVEAMVSRLAERAALSPDEVRGITQGDLDS